jgi:hypothetical protein
MSRQPIARNADLSRLEDEGYALEVSLQGYLLVRNVPYVNPAREVKRGTIIGRFVTQGTVDDIVRFADHTVYFAGETPCDFTGRSLEKVVISSNRQQLGTDLWADHHFSSKPGPNGYPTMYAQVKQYVTILESQAQRIDPQVTAKTGPVISSDTEDEEPFVYTDTASSRAGIVMVTAKLRGLRIAIVGVGGTGSYVLDQVSKTPVAEIHLFDDDTFYTHNAFRGPGAATVEQLRAAPLKVDYWRERYSAMHRGIVTHDYRVTEANAAELASFDFVFLCMDSGPDKLAIVEALEADGVAFIDTGIGVQEVGGALRGTVRVTTSTPEKRDHVRQRVSFAAPQADNDYERNIQVADLNALNAVLAVIKWKKLTGFYHDFEHEYDSTYTINSHLLTRDERYDAFDEDSA